MKQRDTASVGLHKASPDVDQALRNKGIDPDRLSVTRLGLGSHKATVPLWLIRMGFGIMLSAILRLAKYYQLDIPHYLEAMLALILGLIILQAACEVLVVAT
ncbi:MAG: hypothetical protein ACI8Z1_000870 [Candidatus Azotimanducaceae bacterium]|jgi:hypothetical protein